MAATMTGMLKTARGNDVSVRSLGMAGCIPPDDSLA